MKRQQKVNVTLTLLFVLTVSWGFFYHHITLQMMTYYDNIIMTTPTGAAALKLSFSSYHDLAEDHHVTLSFQQQAEQQKKTCVFTISAFNNFGFVWSLYDSIMENSPGRIDCFIWFVGDRQLNNNTTSTTSTTRQQQQEEGSTTTIPLQGKIESVIATLDKFTMVTMEQLDKSLPGFHSMQFGFKFNLVCLQTTIKPYAFMYAFKHLGADSAIFLDNDIWVTAPLDAIVAQLGMTSVVVTPHIISPNPMDGMRQTDKDILQAGVFNFGFVAFRNTPTSMKFLDWWGEQLSLFGFVDVPKGMHFDQNWGMFIPAFFDHDDYFVMRGRQYNIAYWNLHERGSYLFMKDNLPYLKQTESNDDESSTRVVFMHFSGISLLEEFDGFRISRHQNRFTLNDFPVFGDVLNAYMQVLNAHDALAFRSIPYGFENLSDGIQISDSMRMTYASAVFPIADSSSLVQVANDRSYPGAPPYGIEMSPFVRYDFQRSVLHDPFCASHSCMGSSSKKLFWEWALTTIPSHAVDCDGAFFFSALELSIWERRADLQNAFPEPIGNDFNQFKAWFLARHIIEEGLVDNTSYEKWKTLVTYHKEHHFTKFHKPLTEYGEIVGVNIIGWHTGIFSIGIAAKKQYISALSVNIPVGAIHLAFAVDKQYMAASQLNYNLTRSCSHPVNFYIFNADATSQVIDQIPPIIRAYKYNVAYWFWELDEFPQEWMQYAKQYDEIWVGSTFIKASIENSAGYDGTPVKVLHLPYDSFALQQDTSTLASVDIAEISSKQNKFTFLVMFDCGSFTERKNPEGAIRAFVDAFPVESADSQKYMLIVKMHSCTATNFERLKHAAAGDDRIIFINKVLSDEENLKLQQHVDCYISLHRTEGYGLIILETLARGIPVIATNYGGNTDIFEAASDFVGTCIFPVTFELTQLSETVGPYKKGTRWANPDHDFAVLAMRNVVKSNCKLLFGKELSFKMNEHFGYTAVGSKMKDLLIESRSSILKKLLKGEESIQKST
eukprot:CAMPEP_0176500960 /NCGR_PEP_ID=MMETSP0200_2-20121128/13878_1 /TAXON_ID=947934 /ORGANISM="Chaetoceros sp., Strain GSL56" /LENGTH=1002 /DNA_ID=CAMNT_0017899759 /DNA_START=162 /DNA_END=3170 /DNA_ORIENTATION=-